MYNYAGRFSISIQWNPSKIKSGWFSISIQDKILLCSIFKDIFTNLQISLIMLPEALGYYCREAFNGENDHKNHLKVAWK